MFSARAIDGAEAERIGLVERYAGMGLAAAVDSVVASLLAASAASIATLKRGVCLASAGIGQDDEQDRRFDAMLGSDEMADRLLALRKGRGLA